MKLFKLVAIQFLVSIFLISPALFAFEMEWFKGTVEKALVEAKETHRPILIYWGAAWCPPCHALKAVAFRNQEFTTAAKNFVSVYLDGDTKDAQSWGEKFKISGYPTLLVLNENGEEIQRLRASQPPEGLTQELLQAGRNAEPIEKLLDSALKAADPQKIPLDSWQRLARYSWDYNPMWEQRADELTVKLIKLSKMVPNQLSVEKNEFQLLLLGRRIDGLKDGESLSTDEKLEAEGLLRSIISENKKMLTHMQPIVFGATTYLKGLFPDLEKNQIPATRFIMEYRKALWNLFKEKSLTLQNRTYILSTLVDLSSGANSHYPELSTDDRKTVKNSLTNYLSRAKDEHERVVVFNVLPDAFKKIGETDEARKLILKYENKVGVKNDIYSMLSDLDLAQGKLDSALAWSEKAYQVSEGSATRAQWGRIYIKLLIDIAPENADRIEKDSFAIFTEGLSVSDGLQGRNKRSMTKLQSQFLTWAKNSNRTLDLKKYTALATEKCIGTDRDFISQCQQFVENFQPKKN
jgi:protein disulfide-isomerase